MIKMFIDNAIITKPYNSEEPAVAIGTTSNGNPYCRFRIGVSIYDTNYQNNRRWINFTVSGYDAIPGRVEKMGLKEGSHISLVGSFDQKSYTNNQGEEKSYLDIRLDDISFSSFGGSKNSDGNQNQSHPAQQPQQYQNAPAPRQGQQHRQTPAPQQYQQAPAPQQGQNQGQMRQPRAQQRQNQPARQGQQRPASAPQQRQSQPQYQQPQQPQSYPQQSPYPPNMNYVPAEQEFNIDDFEDLTAEM